MNEEEILVTASDNIPYSEIEKQFGIVDSQIVVGANIFRDVFASWRDLFGGETKGYKKDIDKMKKAAMQSIREQAIDKGGNAVLALKIDLDELSGGGKSMFMLNIYGTAVKLKESVFESSNHIDKVNELEINEIEFFKERNKIARKINEAIDITRDVNLDSISKYDLWDQRIASEVLAHSFTANYVLKENFSEIPLSFIEEFLKENIHKIKPDYWDLVYSNFNEKDWFNHQFLYDLIQDENYIKRFRALKLCTLKKKSYKRDEIKSFEILGDFLVNKFDSSVKKREVNKVIGIAKVYVCPYCLQENKMKNSECECGRSKFGFINSGNTPKSIGNYLLEMANAMKTAFSQYNK